MGRGWGALSNSAVVYSKTVYSWNESTMRINKISEIYSEDQHCLKS